VLRSNTSNPVLKFTQRVRLRLEAKGIKYSNDVVLRCCGHAVLQSNTSAGVLASQSSKPLNKTFPRPIFKMDEDFFQGKGLNEIVINPCCHDFLMGFPVQINVGKQQYIGFWIGALDLFDNIDGICSLNDVFGDQGREMVTLDLIESFLPAAGRMDVVSPFLEERLRGPEDVSLPFQKQYRDMVAFHLVLSPRPKVGKSNIYTRP
jgi:hypothetical protein